MTNSTRPSSPRASSSSATRSARRLAGELTEDQFRPHRLMNGLYLQLHAYMLRIAVPYGTLNSRQMRKLAEIARKYDRGYGHFTTRQNLQFNWPALKDAPDILAELASVEMHAIQTSGNCIRNVTADHFAGVAADELADPRPFAEILRQWSSLHPEFSFLPRKFKIAVNGAPHDRAAIQAHDIGLQIVRNDARRTRLRRLCRRRARPHAVHRPEGARFPAAARPARAIVEAILRVYNLEGRRDNKYKARIKILVHEKGSRRLARGGRGGVRRARRRVARPAGRRDRAHRRLFRAAAARAARRRRASASSAGAARTPSSPAFFASNVVAAQGSRLRHRHRVAEADRRRAGRRQRRPDGRGRRPRRGLFAGRVARHRTSRTSSCRMSRSTTCPPSTTGSPPSAWRRPTPG